MHPKFLLDFARRGVIHCAALRNLLVFRSRVSPKATDQK